MQGMVTSSWNLGNIVLESQVILLICQQVVDPEVGKWSSVTASVRHTVSGGCFCIFFQPVKPTISRAGLICSVLREPELETWSMWQHWSKNSTFRHCNRQFSWLVRKYIPGTKKKGEKEAFLLHKIWRLERRR